VKAIQVGKQDVHALPAFAGSVPLRWSKLCRKPRLHKGSIILPLRPWGVFYPLQSGEKFVFLESTDAESLFFGGVDESPFLSELVDDEGILGSVLFRGKDGSLFFKQLIPREITKNEKIFGTKAVRQGDWFAVPIPLSWDRLLVIRQTVEPDFSLRIVRRKRIRLDPTRHFLCNARFIHSRVSFPSSVLIGEGELISKGHSPLILKGPHAFFRTRYLIGNGD